MASRSSSLGKKPRAKKGSGKTALAPNLLAEWVEKAGLGPEVLAALVGWLGKQLEIDQFAKLEQGGHQEGRVPLRKVFVDLPITEQAASDSANEGRLLFLNNLLHVEPVSLCGDLRVVATSVKEAAELLEEPKAGFLVIGGPGQGKSTLAQFACQVHRAALLVPLAHELPPPQREIVAHFRDASADEEIGYPHSPLLPLHVSLPDAAAWLAHRVDRFTSSAELSSGPPALLAWLSEQSEKRGQWMSADVLERLLQHAPFMLVLDGFDEVGDSLDRAHVVAEARRLLRGEKEGGAPTSTGIVVATTRPQGYAGELDGLGVPLETVYLAPLEPHEALIYASKLIENKLADRPEQPRVVEGIREAAEEPTTARLMTTPLQVTILVALVQRMGRAPSERWSLFRRYFETIYERESERGTYAAPLLQLHRMHIERIHARVGLLLQAESEQGGGTDARMTPERLEAVAHAVLSEDGIDEETRNVLVRRILRAAEERLVFLVEPEPGKFGFEIRSLQELMAAWALAEDGEASTEARLLQIAPAPMFRNVSLLLASKFFTDGSRLRESLSDRICPAIQEPTDAGASAACWGAILALEILEEGSVLNQPKYARRLMEQACELVTLPPRREQVRLARVAVRSNPEPLISSIRNRLAEPADARALGAWVAVVEAANQGVDWAVRLADNGWGMVEDPSDIVMACREARVSLLPWLATKIDKSPEKIQPDTIYDWRPRGVIEGEAETSLWPPRFANLKRRLANRRILRFSDGFGLMINLLKGGAASWNASLPQDTSAPQWRSWLAIRAFAQKPTSMSLAAALRTLSAADLWPIRATLAGRSLWPLAACLMTAVNPDELLEFANGAEGGDLGDAAMWIAAERGWPDRSSRSYLDAQRGPLPWDSATLSNAPPFGAGQHLFTHFRAEAIVIRALEQSMNFNPARVADVECVRYLMAGLHRARNNDGARTFMEVPEQWSRISGTLPVGAMLLAIRAGVNVSTNLNLLDRAGRTRVLDWVGAHGSLFLDLLHLFRSNPEHAGLRYWLRKLLVTLDFDASAFSPDFRREAIDVLTWINPEDNPGLVADNALVLLWLGGIDVGGVEPLLGILGKRAEEEPALWKQAADLTRRSALPTHLQEAVLVALLGRPGLSWQTLADIQSALLDVLQSRQSGLADPVVWKRLRLPLPLPVSHLASAQGFTLPDKPVSLSQIRVSHIRGLEDLQFPDLASATSPDKGQWMVILGPNGTGKTTLLRSIVFALRNLADPKIWPEGVWDTPWRANTISPVTKATIEIDLADGRSFSASIEANGSERFTRSPKDAPTPFPIFAYGCQRGSALGGPAREVKIGEDDGSEVATLFNDAASVMHAETWIKEWHGDALEKPEQSGPVYRVVLEALQKLLSVEKIVVRDRKVWVSGDTVGEDIPFSALSDGYLTTAGWFLDLVARWIELAVKHNRRLLDGKILSRMTGIVFIDEIDMHLHPQWQIDIIPRVKELLPSMSFVVTTHNPLTLVGARPEEIWLLDREEGRVSVERGTEAPMLLTGGQIYSRYFGIKSVYPNELGEELRRYGFLSGDPRRTDEEQAEMEGLREKLRKHGIEPGWEETPRVVPFFPAAAPARRPSKSGGPPKKKSARKAGSS